MSVGIYLSNMDMPKDGEMLCVNIYPDGKVCINLDLECKQIATAVSVPTPHGDLIDRRELEETDPLLCDCIIAEDGYVEWSEWGYSLEQIRNAPTIIPAESEGET